MIIKYKKIELKGVKKGFCNKCGQKVIRNKTFWQTQSPYNNKSIDQIYKELQQEIIEWTPDFIHQKCKGDIK